MRLYHLIIILAVIIAAAAITTKIIFREKKPYPKPAILLDSKGRPLILRDTEPALVDVDGNPVETAFGWRPAE